MSRWEFMRQLEELLSDISPYEREEALQYYNDYFNDAGRENEQSVIEALGSPGQVADIVKEGLAENGNRGEFTEKGFTSGTGKRQNEIIKSTGFADAGKETEGRASNEEERAFGKAAYKPEPEKSSQPQKEGMPAWEIVLIVIGCILLSPAIIGLAGSIFGAVCAVIMSLFGIVLGFGVATIVCFVVAAALIIAGVACAIVAPLKAIGLVGGGLICIAVGILCMLVIVFTAGWCIPGICKGISYIFKNIFGKKEGVKA